MTIHYHGTPITPRSVLYELAGRHFCVSFAAPQDVEVCHKIGQSVMLDNGAFSFWRSGNPQKDWEGYYDFCREWMAYQSTWAVIPDIIDGTEQQNDALIEKWDDRMGNGYTAAPVWHLHESFERLHDLIYGYEFPRVCFGSSGEYSVIGSAKWNARMNETFNRLCESAMTSRMPCQIHMLRGMSLSGSIYPFASVDSTDIARNHNRPQNSARAMADRWDAQQCPGRWSVQPEQKEMVLA